MRPSRAPRLAVTSLFLAHGLLFGTWVARIPAVQDQLELGEGELGVALLFITLGAILAMPVAGWIVAREGSRATARQTVVVFAVLLPVLALAPNLVLLALALLLFGAAAGALDIAMNAHGIEVERRYARPILSSFHAGWSFGGLLGAGIGALAAWSGIGPEAHFAAVGIAVGANGLLASAALLPAGADRPDSPPRLARPPRRLIALAVLAFCGLFAEGAAADWSAVYLAGPLTAGAGLAALGFAAFAAAMAGLRLLGDALTTRWGAVALMRRGGLVAGAALAATLLIGDPVAALVGFACMGAGLAAVVPVAFRAAGSQPGVPAGVGIAALTTVGYSAFVVGPPAIGFAAELVGLPLALGIVVVLLGVLVALAAEVQPARPLGAPAPEPLP
jgi:Major Facilitator Superfamily